MTKISVAIIARNREKEIEACIKSVKGVDEIIVLDTGSIDKTPSIAVSLGAKVYYYRWEDDFAAARNRCLDYTQSPWVFSIDSDEVLKTGVDSLYNFVNHNFGSKVVGVRITQPSCDFYGCRLFRKSSAHWIRPVHEQLSANADTYTDKIVIEHRPSKDHEHDPERNIRMLRQALMDNPRSELDAFYLGEELYNVGDYSSSIFWFQHFLRISKSTKNLAHEALFLIGEAYCRLNMVKFGIDSMIEATKSNPEMKAAYERLYRLTRDKTWKEMADRATNADVLIMR